eukprot:GEMP01081733.1.p1 GENE.GEMP01081733.1~~GEMP01081733.1.p1  ORF type:complete len:218 (+),score=27.45 GEMP01081733.1:36-689(+)
MVCCFRLPERTKLAPKYASRTLTPETFSPNSNVPPVGLVRSSSSSSFNNVAVNLRASLIVAEIPFTHKRGVSEEIGDTARNTLQCDTQSTASDRSKKSGSSFGINEHSSTVSIPPRLEHFQQLKCIGKGGFGDVMLVRHHATSEFHAMKILNKAHLVSRNQVAHTKTERQVLEAVVRHPFIVELFYAFQTKQHLYLVMEFCQGGELFFHLVRVSAGY